MVLKGSNVAAALDTEYRNRAYKDSIVGIQSDIKSIYILCTSRNTIEGGRKVVETTVNVKRKERLAAYMEMLKKLMKEEK